MWTKLVNCKKRKNDFLLKLHNGQQYKHVAPFVKAWKREWEQINKENGTGDTKLPRCDASAPLADVHLDLKFIILCWDINVADMWCMGPGYKNCTNMLPGSSPPVDLSYAVVQLSSWIMLQSLWSCNFDSMCFWFIATHSQMMPSLHTLSCSSQAFEAECASFRYCPVHTSLCWHLNHCCIVHIWACGALVAAEAIHQNLTRLRPMQQAAPAVGRWDFLHARLVDYGMLYDYGMSLHWVSASWWAVAAKGCADFWKGYNIKNLQIVK